MNHSGAGRLVVVSNRVPVPSPAGSPTAGGLAVALEAALKTRGGIWFGWSGKTTTEADPPLQAQVLGAVSYVVTDLTRRDLDEYYHGFANRALWPICHYRLDLADLSGRDTNGYFRVNEMFARRLAKMLRPDDVVWVHDYHFIPMAFYLRQMGIANRIGFFLHIPWPSADIASAMPAYERLLRAFAAYDLVGFQTPLDVENFRACLNASQLGSGAEEGWCEAAGRRFQVAAFPIGIDTDAFALEARLAEKNTVVKRTRASLGGRPLIIGVDRLDYSKGIAQRIDTFATFLERSPQAAKAGVTMLQITPKSRSEVPEYAQLQRELAEKVGHLNGKAGDVDWTPLRYINKPMSRSALAGLYRIAQIGLVTPLRDGMNLVAKEYVAAQLPDDPGVLILSRFAGAAHELDSALLVNPYDIEATATAIARGFLMSLEERRERWTAMMDKLKKNNIDFWAQNFLSVLGGSADLVGPSINAPDIMPAPRRDREAWLPGSSIWTTIGH